MEQSYWNEDTLRARIADVGLRKRYPAGSPDAQEIAVYGTSLSQCVDRSRGVVLGMTPELRSLALSHFQRIVTIDSSAQSIELFRGWIADEAASREKIILASWLVFLPLLKTPVSAILGDGIFGNLSNLSEHVLLLEKIKSAMADDGFFVTRKAMIPKNFEISKYSSDAFIARFRSGVIDEAEFGFGMRLLGHYACCYNPDSFILDNQKIFEECDGLHRNGRLTDGEYDIIQRYFFNGKNCIIPEDVWENLLNEAGFIFEALPCQGKEWYSYYKIYRCQKTAQRWL